MNPLRHLRVLAAFFITFSCSIVCADVFTECSLNSGGAERTYYVHKADTISSPVPLVVVLHGGGGNGKGLQETYGFKPMIANGEFVAVYPNAGTGGWLPEQVDFLDAVIDQVFARERVDRERLFVTGASRGGLMTFVMAAKSKHAIHAAGTVITSQMAILARDYPIERPIDFAMIAGTEDPLMPYAGGWGALGKPKTTGDPDGRVLPVEESIGLLLNANRLDGEPAVSSLGNKDPDDGCTNEVRTWTDAKSRRCVMLVKVEGGGHVVPGGRQYLSKSLIGPACKDFDHAEVMWNFFKTVGLARAVAKDEEDADAKRLGAESEKSLRERVAAMYSAMLASDVAKCIELSDPQVVRKTGRDKSEQFFNVVIGLVRFAKLGPNDRRIKSITPLDNDRTARVEVEVTKPRRATSIELWGKVDGKWYYRETVR